MRKKPEKQQVILERMGFVEEAIHQFEVLRNEANDAVCAVTTAMENLDRVNGNMSKKIDEIDSYVMSLNGIRDEIATNLAKNEKVRSNFAALLCVEE